MKPLSSQALPLAIQGLTVRRGGRAVLHGLDLHLAAGARLGIIGRNGSGKSTLLRTCAGLLAFDGRVRVGPHLPGRPGTAAHLGWMPDRPIHPRMSVSRLCRSIARLHGATPPDVAPFGLDPAASTHALSQGQARLLAFVLASLHAPGLLLLDEPFTGLDPDHADRLHRALSAHSGSLVLTGHRVQDFRGLTTEHLYLRGGALHAESGS